MGQELKCLFFVWFSLPFSKTKERKIREFRRFLPEGDRTIVLTAVSQDGFALRFATQELKGDREIVMAAVSQDGEALQYATKEVKGDEEILQPRARTLAKLYPVGWAESCSLVWQVFALSAPSPGDDLRSKSAIRLRGQIARSESFWEIGLRFLCGNDTVAVAMHFAMKNGQICFSLRKFLAISPAIQKIASDCGCDAVVHLGVAVKSSHLVAHCTAIGDTISAIPF